MHIQTASAAVATVVLAALLPAQMTTFVPDGFQAVEANTNWPYPFNYTNTTGMRQQAIYDSGNFTALGITGPILINRLRWRADGGATCSGRVFNNVAVHLSSCPVDYTAVTGSFASNQGLDLTTVFNGPVTANPIAVGATPGPMFVDIALTTPFSYDPSLGADLVIDVDHDGTAGTGTSARMDMGSTGLSGSMLFSTTSRTAPSAAATSVRIGSAMMMEVGWLPPAGLAAGFAASTRTGTSPMTVSFTDQSWSSDPAGVLAWNWDFDNDTIIDATVQNPTFTYTQCGSYTVSLTVFDAAHPAQTLTRIGHIVTDTVAVSFTHALLAPPNVWQFTDTSTPVPQAWAWDFDGDNITDSTLQNPAWAFATSCSGQTVRLDATLRCRVSRGSRTLVVAPSSLATVFTGGGGINSANTVGNMFDVSVTAPDGISVCALTMTPYTFFGPYTLTVYITADSYLGRDATASAWRQVATGTGFGVAGGFNPPTPGDVALASPFYLPAGNYGVAVYISGVPYNSLAYSSVAIGPFSNADLTLFPNPSIAPGIAKGGLFAAAIYTGKWNGAFHYTRNGISADAGYGFFGEGCSGSLGVPGNVATSLPRLNTAFGVSLTNLPQNAALFVLGFSRTSSVFGPLPLDLLPFGAPGCLARVRPDAVVLLFGGGNTATLNLALPNAPGLLGSLFYTQGLVLDQGTNTAGLVTSDAAGAVVGR